MRNIILCFTASAAVVLGSASLASAGWTDVRSKWRDCDSTSSGLSYRTTFPNPARYYGHGRYLIKSQIRWDKYAYGMWRKRDANTIQTPWTKITNEEYDFSQAHGDRTVWGNDLYYQRWRAHVIVKLIKNRKGPKDKRVETVERSFEKAVFPERGSCGVTIGS